MDKLRRSHCDILPCPPASAEQSDLLISDWLPQMTRDANYETPAITAIQVYNAGKSKT
jgi:hypothetical protein